MSKALTLTAAALLGTMTASAQVVLSTAEFTALQDLENKKTQLQKDFNAAADVEIKIEQEFALAHPGWHINGTTFVVEKEPDPVKPPVPNAVKPPPPNNTPPPGYVPKRHHPPPQTK